MKTDPLKIAIRHTARGEALRRAARLASSAGRKVGRQARVATPVVLNKAFACLSAPSPSSQAATGEPPSTLATGLFGDLSNQRKSLEAQRQRLTKLLADLDNG